MKEACFLKQAFFEDYMKKKFLIYFFFVTALSLAGFSFYCFHLINDISVKLEDVSKNNGDLRQAKNFLEQGSVANKKDLSDYILFSDYRGSYKNWLKENAKNLEPFSSKSHLIHLNDDSSIPLLSNNHCSLAYCYQHKLPFNEIPALFWKSLIGIEDIRFIFHNGVDIKSILRALWVDLKAGKFVQGGSTITQQLVKNLYLSNEKTISRKIKEFIIALYVERVFSKEKILESYFNEFIWGSLQGIKVKGVYSASLFYFGKKITSLKPYEVAVLIAMLKGPYFYHPIRKTGRLRARVDYIFKKLKKLSLLPVDEQAWNQTNWVAWKNELTDRESGHPYKSLERASLESGKDVGGFDDFERYIFFKKAQALRTRLLKKLKFKKDITVKAIIGNPSLIKKGENLFYYYSKRQRSLKRSIEEEYHQVGSLLKPILYSLFAKKGYGLSYGVSTEKMSLLLKSGAWSPKDSHKDLPGILSLEQTLLMSLNGPVIRMASQVGFSWLERELTSIIPRLRTPLAEFPAQLLGSVELSLKEIYSIYEKFILDECLVKINGVTSKSIVSALSYPNRGTVRRKLGPFFKNLRYFGKTGTSNKGQDNWYLFYTGDELGVIWVGNEGARTQKDLNLYGSTTSFSLFKEFYSSRGKGFSEFNCIN